MRLEQIINPVFLFSSLSPFIPPSLPTSLQGAALHLTPRCSQLGFPNIELVMSSDSGGEDGSDSVTIMAIPWKRTWKAWVFWCRTFWVARIIAIINVLKLYKSSFSFQGFGKKTVLVPSDAKSEGWEKNWKH